MEVAASAGALSPAKSKLWIVVFIFCFLGLLIDGLIRTLERFALAWRPTFVRN